MKWVLEIFLVLLMACGQLEFTSCQKLYKKACK
jgi:hypothetical protein